jgi:hypothetical protein
MLPGTGKAAWFPEIHPGRAETRVIPYRPERRGTVPSFACTVSTRFPFALFEKSAEVDPRGSSLIVYPEPAGPDVTVPGFDPADRTGGPAAGGREGASIRGVRDHSPSDPVRDIHVLRCEREGLLYRLQVGNRVLVGPADEGRRRRALSILARVQADGTLLPTKKREGA